MSEIIIGEKGGDKEGYYEAISDTLVRLGKFKIGWFSSKYTPTNEKTKRSFYYVQKEHGDARVL